MPRTLDDSRRWAADGDTVFRGAVTELDAEAHEADSALPGWKRKHVVAHVAANADALGNLVRWAATGIETPMYASPEDRATGITRGAQLPADELTAWLTDSAAALATTMARLTPEQWNNKVRTAQGRTVTATELPWMRAREVWVHAVDLATGVGFPELPAGFLQALTEEIRLKRGMATLPEGPSAEVAAWLAGRPHSLPGAPELSPWL